MWYSSGVLLIVPVVVVLVVVAAAAAVLLRFYRNQAPSVSRTNALLLPNRVDCGLFLFTSDRLELLAPRKLQLSISQHRP